MKKVGRKNLIILAIFSTAYLSFALPQGGTIKAGSGSISKISPSQMQINQHSQKLIIDWKSFNIWKGESVRFIQPSASSIALNRVVGQDPTRIYGLLSANGQVWVINPNGILVGPTGKINTAGFIASTLNIKDEDFLKGNYRFFIDGRAGKVISEGQIKGGKYVAFVAPEIINRGAVETQGSAYLLSGKEITLYLDGDTLVGFEINKGVAQEIGIVNEGRIVGHKVILSAKAYDKVLRSVVNTQGIIEATKVVNEGGVIKLVAEGGKVEVGGELKAEGGFIETSGDSVEVKKGTKVKAGHWLIDPTNITIDENLAQTIETQLRNGDVTVQTPADGSEEGNIYVNAPISWSANKLTLSAHNDINVNAVLTASGNAKLELNYGGSLNMKLTPDGFEGRIDFPGRSGTGFLKINGYDYYVIQNVNELQNIKNNLGGLYALGSDIDASETRNWNDGKGFEPIGDKNNPFVGVLKGLGHKITGLYINRPSENYVGLFGYIMASGLQISNIGLKQIHIAGFDEVGSISGYILGSTIKNIYLNTIDITADQHVGGLTGSWNVGKLSWVLGTNITIEPFAVAGGLIGLAESVSITNTGLLKVFIFNGMGDVGGMVGFAKNSYIENAWVAGGTISGGQNVGGLAGSIQNTKVLHALILATALNGGGYIGGITGFSSGGLIEESITFAFGLHYGPQDQENFIGGLVGYNQGTIKNSYSMGEVRGTYTVGGLCGLNGGNVINSYSITRIDSTIYTNGKPTFEGNIGGLIGRNIGLIQNSFWDIDTSGINTSAGGTGLSTADMKKLSTFQNAGWDISDDPNANTIWRIYEGKSYPVLRALQKKVVVKANDITKVYDGKPFYGGSYSVNYPEAPVVGTPVYGGNSQGAKDAGTYTITISGLSLDRKTHLDYQIWGDIVFEEGTLTIKPRPITLVGVKYYDGLNRIDAQDFTIYNLVQGETLNLKGFVTTLSPFPGIYRKSEGTLINRLILGDGTGKASNYVVEEVIGIIDYRPILPNLPRQISLINDFGEESEVKELILYQTKRIEKIQEQKERENLLKIERECVNGGPLCEE